MSPRTFKIAQSGHTGGQYIDIFFIIFVYSIPYRGWPIFKKVNCTVPPVIEANVNLKCSFFTLPFFLILQLFAKWTFSIFCFCVYFRSITQYDLLASLGFEQGEHNGWPFDHHNGPYCKFIIDSKYRYWLIDGIVVFQSLVLYCNT